MISIPLYFVLFIYFGVALILAALFFMHLAHLFHTGTLTLTSFVITFACLAGVTIIFWGTWYLTAGTDWQLPIVIWNNAWFGSVFSTNQIFSPFK